MRVLEVSGLWNPALVSRYSVLSSRSADCGTLSGPNITLVGGVGVCGGSNRGLIGAERLPQSASPGQRCLVKTHRFYQVGNGFKDQLPGGEDPTTACAGVLGNAPVDEKS